MVPATGQRSVRAEEPQVAERSVAGATGRRRRRASCRPPSRPRVAAAGLRRLAARATRSASASFFASATGPSPSRAAACCRDVTIAYETWGTLADDALQRRARLPRPHRRQPRRRPAAARPAARRAGGTASSGRARPIDTDRWFVVCANVLGGCQGTHRPGQPAPRRRQAVGQPLPGGVRARLGAQPGARWPTTSASDRWHSVVGGSMGGMQALEWAVMYPERVALDRPDRHRARRPARSRSRGGRRAGA